MKRLGSTLFGFACISITAIVAADQTFTTPRALSVRERSGCLIFEARNGGAAPRNTAACEKLGPTPMSASLYQWSPDFLVEAFDQAERGMCPNRTLGCVVNGRDVQMFVAADGVPNAMIGPFDPSQPKAPLSVAVSSGLLDFVEASESSYLRDGRADVVGVKTQIGLTQWISAIDALGGKPCQFRVPSPFRKPVGGEFVEIRTASQAFYEWAMGHELAHAKAPDPNCGTGAHPDPMTREQACDRQSFMALATAAPPRTMPLFVIAPLVAMSHYEHVLNGRFGRLLAPQAGGGFLDVFRAADFSKRATALVDRWEQYCQTVSPDPLTCPPGGVGMLVAEARRLLALPLPTECKDTSTTEAERAFAGPLPGTTTTSFCDGMTDLLYAARTRFASVKSGNVDVDEDDGTQNWDSSVGIPNGKCSIWQTKAGRTYGRCTLFESKADDAGAEAAYKSAAQSIRACVTSAWTLTESNDDAKTIKRALRGEASAKGRELSLNWFRYPSSGRSSVALTLE